MMTVHILVLADPKGNHRTLFLSYEASVVTQAITEAQQAEGRMRMLQPLRERMDKVIEHLRTAAEPEPELVRGDGDKYSHPRSRPRHKPLHDPVKRDKRKREARQSRRRNRR